MEIEHRLGTQTGKSRMLQDGGGSARAAERNLLGRLGDLLEAQLRVRVQVASKRHQG